MGIYDRDYYRREGPSFLESLGGRANVCKWLIIVNIAVFLLQVMANYRQGRFDQRPDAVTAAFALTLEGVESGEVWRLLTYAFLHADFLHIAFNMLFLWWFGKDMEELYGWKEFLAFYLVAAVVGGLAYVLGGISDVTPSARVARCVGASGAVTAVMVLCACRFPTQVIYFWMVPIPIWLFVAFQVGQDLFGLLGGGDRTTAFAVHLGGAAFAFAYYKLDWRLLAYWPDFHGWRQRRSRPQLRVYRGEDDVEELHMPTPVPVAASSREESYEELKAQVDKLLEKKLKSGLTEGEQRFLEEASAEYRKRRKPLE